MAKVKFKLDINGLRQLMKSAEMQSCLDEYGAEVAGRVGDDYGHRVHVADYVAICNVYPDSAEAAKANYEDNTLLTAIGG